MYCAVSLTTSAATIRSIHSELNRTSVRDGVEDLEDLLLVGLGVGDDLMPIERLARLGTTAGIADHPREVADQKDRAVAAILEVAQLLQHDRVAEMQVRRRGIRAELDAQRFSALRRALELANEIVLGDDLDRATPQDGQLFADRPHDAPSSTSRMRRIPRARPVVSSTSIATACRSGGPPPTS